MTSESRCVAGPLHVAGLQRALQFVSLASALHTCCFSLWSQVAFASLLCGSRTPDQRAHCVALLCGCSAVRPGNHRGPRLQCPSGQHIKRESMAVVSVRAVVLCALLRLLWRSGHAMMCALCVSLRFTCTCERCSRCRVPWHVRGDVLCSCVGHGVRECAAAAGRSMASVQRPLQIACGVCATARWCVRLNGASASHAYCLCDE